jgi:hypothetical protein
MIRGLMYTLAGQTPVPESDLLRWAYWMETADRVVAQDRIGASLISTVFLGLDHRHFGDGPPLVFETMIFTDGEAEDIVERCSTWLEAEAQHARAVEAYRKRVRL